MRLRQRLCSQLINLLKTLQKPAYLNHKLCYQLQLSPAILLDIALQFFCFKRVIGESLFALISTSKTI